MAYQGVKISMRTFPLLSLVVALTFTAAPVTAQIPLSDHEIVPSQRIGPIQLGMFEQDVVALLGQPTKVSDSYNKSAVENDRIYYQCEQSNPGRCYRFFYWYETLKLHVDFSMRPAARVRSVSVWSPGYTDKNGVGIGASAVAVIKAYGDGERRVQASLSYPGIVFYFDSADKVKGIVVSAP